MITDSEFSQILSDAITAIWEKEIKEDYIRDLTYNKLDFIGPQTVPDGCVFVMGDNRNESTDSRNSLIGMVDSRLIIGKVLYVIYPLDAFRKVQ